jgi:hypothetical protein|tara:strand:- start:1104 stop:1712 length:609 start_codon:yes stop_codon:yes gene_type:complete
MANQDTPFGLRYVRNLQGNYNSSGQSRYRLTTAAATNTTNIYQGDIVTQDTGGIVTRIARADGGSATSALIVGVFNGCFYTDPTTSKPTWSNYWPGNAATDAVAFIYDSPMDVFEMQADAAFPVADLFGNFDIVDNTGTGSTASGISYVELDVSTGATTATLPVKALDISQDPENSDVSTANTNVLVTIQNHLFGAKAVGLA